MPVSYFRKRSVTPGLTTDKRDEHRFLFDQSSKSLSHRTREGKKARRTDGLIVWGTACEIMIPIL